VTPRDSPRRPVLPTSPFPRQQVPQSSTNFRVGDRVTFDRCGMGRVVKVDDAFVTVDFGSAGVRRIAVGTASLHLL
jgi:hypothetical protein